MRPRSALALLVLALLAAACADRTPLSLVEPPESASFTTAGCELDVDLADAYAEIDALVARVNALEASGALNAGQARALRNHLENARRHLDEGRLCPALAQLRAFREQVGNFVSDGVLSTEEAAPLLAGADHILGEVPTPVHIRAAVSAGQIFTCALRPSGRAYCWGLNLYGNIGDGTFEDRLLPTPVSGGHTFVAITLGNGHACALDPQGRAYCWGLNFHGQLGDGTNTNRSPPTPVAGNHTFVSITAGYFSTCGIRTDGASYCWGANDDGNLGDGTDESRTIPTLVHGSHHFTSLSLSRGQQVNVVNTCGIRSDGRALCWGRNWWGQLGDGTTTNRLEPTPVSDDHTFIAITAGGSHSCGIRDDHRALCWGLNLEGILGDGTQTDRLVPTLVEGDHSWSAIAAGGSRTCGIRTDGAAYCWGFNTEGRLGDGTTDFRQVPTPVSGSHTFTEIAVSFPHACALRTDGALLCWGYNGWGALGDGTTTSRWEPTPVSGWTALP